MADYLMKDMNEGILEVLLVSAKGIRKKHHIGKSSYYVVIECGDHSYQSKVTPGNDNKALWNQKFMFHYSYLDWLNTTHLKLKIMDEETLSHGNFIGETSVHLGGIITEGSDKGVIEVKPMSYNVVLEDDSYKGEIKIGLKFFSNAEIISKGRNYTSYDKQASWSICTKVFSFFHSSERKMLSLYNRLTTIVQKRE